MPSPDDIKAAAQAASFMSQQSLQWWFSALFLLFVGSGGFVLWILFKYHSKYVESLTTQLSEQRAAHEALNNKLIEYISKDHAESLKTMSDVASALRDMSTTLKETRDVLTKHAN